ncbi:Eukaryotic translation initiation factor 4E type 2 [Actinomortierella wolfii]|nr:Eukaryotic translation initiation factor 4E type 2 [Actinomortierella wolfii]
MDQAWGTRKSTRSESSSKLIQLQRQSSTSNVSASSLLGAGSGSTLFNHSGSTQGAMSNNTNNTTSLESTSKHYNEASGTGSVGGGAGTTSGTSTISSTSLALHHSSVGTSEIHPLHFNWVFWFMHRAPGSKIVNYESSMKKIATFGSVEDFWAVYSHLRRPHELPNVSDYHLFKQGVRPVWEDATNINGGKWIVRLKKGLASRYWENLVMAVIGDQFDVGSEICGIVLSIRGAEDILSLWNQSAHEGRINLKIRDTMKRVLNLPPDTIMEYKTHNDALKDNSSFRNTDVFR